MTRINVIDPKYLCDQHLLAEYRELTRIPNSIVSRKAKLNGSYPEKYMLGSGHVKFFYNKLGYLKSRYDALHIECLRRGFKVQYIYPESVPESLSMDYIPTNEDIYLNFKRLLDRMPSNARYMSKIISREQYVNLISGNMLPGSGKGLPYSGNKLPS